MVPMCGGSRPCSANVSRSASVNAVPLLRRGLMSRLYPERCVRITGWPGADDPSVADSGALDLGLLDTGSVDPNVADPDSVDSLLKGKFSRVAELLAKRINAAR